MKYREVSANCKCGEPRRPGQRTCKACHAQEARDARRDRGTATPAEAIERAVVRAAKKRVGRKLPPEFEARLRGLAERVADEIDRFNQGAA